MTERATTASGPVSSPDTPALRRLQDLPGPRPWPLVGNTLQFDRPHVHQDMEALARAHGPCFLVSFMDMPVLVVADHALTHQIMRARPHDFSRSRRLEREMRDLRLKPGLFNAEGETWHRQRRMVMAGFTPQRVRAYFPAMLRVLQRLQTRWQRAATEGAPIDLQADLMRYTVDTITGLAFGQEVNTLEAEGDVIQRHLDVIFPTLFNRVLGVVPYWRLFKLPSDHAVDRSVAEVHRAIADFMARARERLRQDPARRENPPNLLEVFLVAAEQEGSGVGDDDVTGNVLTMLLAGEDTTANTLAWMIWLLHKHPQVLARARDEVRAAAPNGLADFTPELMDSLDYLGACAHETMRLKPVGPFMPVEALRDMVIGDVAVPAGTLIWNVLRHESVSEQHVPQAAAFQPERWLAEHNPAKNLSIPFGSGPRICPGRYLALLEIKMAMALLLSAFDIVDVRTDDGGEARETMAFTMGPSPLTLVLRTASPVSDTLRASSA